MIKESLKLFIKSAFVTALFILIFISIYLGLCKSYESVRKNCYGDERPAVAVGDGYFKFFDMELFY